MEMYLFGKADDRIEEVLNLVLNGYSLKFYDIAKDEVKFLSFKPCFKWLLPKIYQCCNFNRRL